MKYSNNFKKRLLYLRKDFTDKQAGYARQDETFTWYRKFLYFKNFFFDKALLGKNFYYSNSMNPPKSFDLKTVSTWDSFNDSYFSFIRKKKWKKYQKVGSLQYIDVYEPKSVWRNKYLVDFSKLLLSEFRKNTFIDFERKFENFRYNYQGKKTLNAYTRGKIESNSNFYFVEHNRTNYSFLQDKKRFFWKSSVGARARAFSKQLKREFVHNYKPLRRKTFNTSFFSKIWRRVAHKAAISYFGHRKWGEVRSLAKAFQKRPFYYGKAGYRTAVESYSGYYASEFVYTLRLAPTYEAAKNIVSSGFVLVDGKVFQNPNKQIPVFSTVQYKGDWVRTYLLNFLNESDNSFSPYPRRSFYKNSKTFLGRSWPPGYIEISFKLEEAVLLRKSFRVEQPKPYAIHMFRPFRFLLERFRRQTPSVT